MKMKSPSAAAAVFMTRICTVNEVVVQPCRPTTWLAVVPLCHYDVSSINGFDSALVHPTV